MKRFSAIILALALIFVLTVSVAAQDSETGKKYYNITAVAEGSGTADESVNKVEQGTGDTVVLTAAPDEGYFTRWIIRMDSKGGEAQYEILDGKTLEDPEITIRPSSDIYAIASFSIDREYLSMFAKAVTSGKGTASVDIPKVLKGSDTQVTFTATELEDEFIEWEFQCEYTIVKGDLKSKVVTIIPYTDVTGIAYFNQGATPPNPDEGDTSPKTGDPLPYVIAIMAIALGAAVVATMKLKKN